MPNQLSQKLEKLYSLRARGIKPGLSRINKLLDHIGRPETNYPIIHVAGTNGKGSSCRIMQSILTAAGYRTGIYTSPHLLRFNERIRIDEVEISDRDLLRLFEKFEDFMDISKASFFEITTAMALDYFREQSVDIAVLEVGLGGRFDATNAVTPGLSVITAIGMDHEEYLGNTIEAVTFEKAGIIKTGIPVVIGRQTDPKIVKILQNISKRRNSEFFSVSDACIIHEKELSLECSKLSLQIFNQFFQNINYPLSGNHMLDNLLTALTALSIFPGRILSGKTINSGLHNLNNPGRFELISQNPVIIYDVAHNISGIKITIETIRKYFPQIEIDVLISMKATKNLDTLGQLLKKLNGKVYVTEMESVESKKVSELHESLNTHIDADKIIQNKNLKTTLNEAISNRKTPLLILGSHYMAESIYSFQKKNLTKN